MISYFYKIIAIMLLFVIIYIIPISINIKIVIFLIIFIIIDYYILKKYKDYEYRVKINKIIELIINQENYNEINDKIDEIKKKREEVLKKVIDTLIKNKHVELKNTMIVNIKQETEITSEVVKEHLIIYKNDLKDYKIYLRNFVKSLNESKEISIIIGYV